jgi:hypothetical protein
MKRIILAVLVFSVLSACATKPMTEEERDQLQRRHERLLETRGFRY